MNTDVSPPVEPEVGLTPPTPPPLVEFAPESYFDSLMAVVDAHARSRQDALRALRTVEDWSERRDRLDGSLREMVGAFPERTPLRARVLERTNRAGYVCERVVFESRPRFYVTANLYLPKEQNGPAPGVLVPCGHAAAGKAFENYQRVAIHLALKGFAALVYDPLGQGERIQYWTLEGRAPLLGAGPPEHFSDGNLCYLLGTNLAQFRVWDGMRALDYLCSRPEVDAARLGCTGVSGGGTLTTYLAALDNRLKCAAPCCYVTTFRDRFLSRRMADPEQNLLPLLAAGMELADLLALFAPRPLLIGAARQDYFPLVGARRAFQDLRSLYRLLGVTDHVAMVEVDGPHGWSLGLRQASCAWMMRWLAAEDHSPTEPEINVAREPDTWCFPEGNLYWHVRGASVSDMLAHRMRELKTARPAPLAPSLVGHDREVLLDHVRRGIRCQRPEATPAVRWGETTSGPAGTQQELQFQTEPRVFTPATLCLPGEAAEALPAVVATSSKGRQSLLASEGLAASLMNAGLAVLCVDPRGIGETASKLPPDSDSRWRDRDAELAYVALMAGVIPLGRRVHDLWHAVQLLSSLEQVDSTRVGLLGLDRAAAWMAHLGVLAEDLSFVAQVRPLISYECLFSRADYEANVADFVPRALLDYDLPQLVSLMAPVPQLILNPLGADGKVTTEDEINAFYDQARMTYEEVAAEERLTVHVVPDEAVTEQLLDWLEQRKG